MKKRPNNRAGFTFVEILIAATISLVVLAGVYNLVYCSNILTAKCFAINSTNVESRNALDQLQSKLQTAYTVPLPFNTAGVALSSTLTLTGTAAIPYAPVYTGTTATVTGTGAGIRFYRYVGGPFQAKIPSGGLLANAGSISIIAGGTTQLPLPTLQKYDILVINRTAIVSGTGFQVWATVGANVGTGTTLSAGTYTVTLTGTMTTDASGTTALTGTAIQAATDSNGQAITFYTTLLRPTAFLFYPTVNSSGTTTELRMLDPCVMNGNNVDVTKNVTTITRNVDNTATATVLPSQFGIVSLASGTCVSAILHIRASDSDNYLANKQMNSFSTYMGLGTLIHLKSMP